MDAGLFGQLTPRVGTENIPLTGKKERKKEIRKDGKRGRRTTRSRRRRRRWARRTRRRSSGSWFYRCGRFRHIAVPLFAVRSDPLADRDRHE